MSSSLASEPRTRLRKAPTLTTLLEGSPYSSNFMGRDQLDEIRRPDPLIEGVIPRGSYGLLTGRDQSYKSFVALDWALCVATGTAWSGKCVESARVLYVVGEGSHGFRARVEAWEHKQQTRVASDRLVVVPKPPDLHKPGEYFDVICKVVHELKVELVVVDTLRRVSGGADENSSQMGPVVNNLGRIRDCTNNGTVLVVAHTNKGDVDSRGYSGIEDDADFVHHAKRNRTRLILTTKKMKDGPDGVASTFQAERSRDSIVLIPLGPATATRGEVAAQILRELRKPEAGGKRTYKELQAATGKSRATVYRHCEDLENEGLIEKAGVGRLRLAAVSTEKTSSKGV